MLLTNKKKPTKTPTPAKQKKMSASESLFATFHNNSVLDVSLAWDTPGVQGPGAGVCHPQTGIVPTIAGYWMLSLCDPKTSVAVYVGDQLQARVTPSTREIHHVSEPLPSIVQVHLGEDGLFVIRARTADIGDGGRSVRANVGSCVEPWTFQNLTDRTILAVLQNENGIVQGTRQLFPRSVLTIPGTAGQGAKEDEPWVLPTAGKVILRSVGSVGNRAEIQRATKQITHHFVDRPQRFEVTHEMRRRQCHFVIST